MSIFTQSQGAWGIFGPSFCGGGTQATVSFVRAAALVQHRAPVQSPAGEVLQSYVAIGPYTGDLQPEHGGLQRQIGGQVVEVAYRFFVPGAPNLRELDRAIIGERQVEVAAVNQWGGEYCEALLRYIGR